jgi:hypothetical protein
MDTDLQMWDTLGFKALCLDIHHVHEGVWTIVGLAPGFLNLGGLYEGEQSVPRHARRLVSVP